MKLMRTVPLTTWDDAAAQRAIEYLRTRRFVNARASSSPTGPIVAASRGSWLGNFTSFDMTKLRAEIHLSSAAVRSVEAVLDVTTFGQQITQWNKATWRLELIELDRVLRGLGTIDGVWARFKPDARAAAFKWTLTLMEGGQRLPPDWEAELQELERGDSA